MDITDLKWKKKASNIIKAELKKKGVGYPDLCQKLQQIGILETIASITTKINRGTFSFAFFLQCISAIGTHTLHLTD